MKTFKITLFFIFLSLLLFQCGGKRLVKKSSFTKPEVKFGEIKKINIRGNNIFINFSLFVKNNANYNIKIKLRDLTAYDEQRQIIGIIQQINTINRFPKGIKKEIFLRLKISKKKLIQKSRDFFFNNEVYILVKGNLSIILPFIILDYPLLKEYQLQLFK